MNRLQSDDEMNMVGGAADLERYTSETPNDAAEVRVNARANRVDERRHAFFRTEDQVVVKADVG